MQTLLPALHGSDFASQPHFTESNRLAINRPVFEAGDDCQQKRQIRAGFTHFDTTHHVYKDILICHVQPTVPVQHGQQHGHAILLQAYRNPTGITQRAGIHQRLYLNQQRAGAFPENHHQGAGTVFLCSSQKNSGRILHLFHALLGHGENTQFIHCTKPIFLTAQDAIFAVGAAFQHHETVDHVFQDFRTGEISFLSDVSDQKQYRVGLFCVLNKVSRAFPNLADTAGRGGYFAAVHDLNRIHDQQRRLVFLSGMTDLLDIGFSQHLQRLLWQVQALRPHPNLLQGFFSGDIKSDLILIGQSTHDLQQQGALTRPGITSHQND